MITISVILLSVIHPGLYANDIHDCGEHRSKSMRLMDLKSWDGPDQAPTERYEPSPVPSNRYEVYREPSDC
ncbi:hypothetical protein FOXG_22142 [Fusarium oxysporum f. sp. lycopersici 4287]|uniref:Uncharacterized protein n=2 Tax=Fusarium oxysporum TaxID=5507 RepID=A0A0J9W662_FUSO4|nr:hypothetical protein FOXG_22142 [Fusarium oxysporum f. sp. lycopersici 4287]EXK26694.1 hypothetical protein FOMG_16755 [Fusarium oxysporum f. sp. melonis 26406]KNB18196.1 hypothetical protein FOXG_22142 [Fusarium oxysporum f. sp. lycopersici 4287]